MRISRWHYVGGLLLVVYLVFSGNPLSAQEQTAPDESLRLPEVVITGIDRSKIQRSIPNVSPDIELPFLADSAHDLSDAFVREGERAFRIQSRQAEQQYLKALELDPQNSTVYLRLGALYRSLNKYVEAANAYQNALTIRTNLPEAHYQLGLLYESHLQDPAKAIEHYQAYLDLGGTDQRVKIWLRNAKRQTTETTVE